MAERKIAYDRINNKANVGFRITAPSLERLYIDTALALTDILVSMDLIKTEQKKTLQVTGETREKLLTHWLNEILGLFEKEKFLARRIVFDKFDGKQITATLFGETYISTRHGSAPSLKSVSVPQLQMGQADQPDLHFFAQVFLL